MLQRTKEGEAFTLLYIFCVGSYRGLYLINWIYRYLTEPHYWQVRIFLGCPRIRALESSIIVTVYKKLRNVLASIQDEPNIHPSKKTD